MSAADLGFFLVGCLVGALGVFVLTGLAIWFLDVRAAVTEGTELDGEGIERAKRRGDL